MTRNEDLGNQLQKLNENGQQLQHQAEMLTRRLPVARTALETIAKGDIGPAVLQFDPEAFVTRLRAERSA
jgi:prefoldin subunit 5